VAELLVSVPNCLVVGSELFDADLAAQVPHELQAPSVGQSSPATTFVVWVVVQVWVQLAYVLLALAVLSHPECTSLQEQGRIGLFLVSVRAESA